MLWHKDCPRQLKLGVIHRDTLWTFKSGDTLTIWGQLKLKWHNYTHCVNSKLIIYNDTGDIMIPSDNLHLAHISPYIVPVQIQWYSHGDNLHVTAHTLPAEPCLLTRTHDGNSGIETPGPFKHGEMDLGTHYINSNIIITPVWWHTHFGNSNMVTHTEHVIKILTWWYLHCDMSNIHLFTS